MSITTNNVILNDDTTTPMSDEEETLATFIDDNGDEQELPRCFNCNAVLDFTNRCLNCEPLTEAEKARFKKIDDYFERVFAKLKKL